jgi:hypothetical protein
MIRDRGYQGSVIQVRRVVATLRPIRREPFLQLHKFPAEEAQVDWAHFGEVRVVVPAGAHHAAEHPPVSLGNNYLVAVTSYGPIATTLTYQRTSNLDFRFVSRLNLMCNAATGNRSREGNLCAP